MGNYYDDHLSANRLKRVYDLAPARVRRYLDAEITHVISHLNDSHLVLELGCGYGRVLAQLAQHAREDAVRKYSWESYLERLERVFYAAIAGEPVNLI